MEGVQNFGGESFLPKKLSCFEKSGFFEEKSRLEGAENRNTPSKRWGSGSLWEGVEGVAKKCSDSHGLKMFTPCTRISAQTSSWYDETITKVEESMRTHGSKC